MRQLFMANKMCQFAEKNWHQLHRWGRVSCFCMFHSGLCSCRDVGPEKYLNKSPNFRINGDVEHRERLPVKNLVSCGNSERKWHIGDKLSVCSLKLIERLLKLLTEYSFPKYLNSFQNYVDVFGRCRPLFFNVFPVYVLQTNLDPERRFSKPDFSVSNYSTETKESPARDPSAAALNQTSKGQSYRMSDARIFLLAKILKCSRKNMKILMKENSFFDHLSPEVVKEKVDVLQSFGLPLTWVHANPRVLYHSSELEIVKRLKLLKEKDFLNTNSLLNQDGLGHYLECNNETFSSAFKYLCERKDSLEGCVDQLEYLQFRLQCSKEEAETLLNSYPLVRGVSEIRLKQQLDFFLKEAELPPNFVIKYRKLLAFSVDRLRSRWKIMREAGITSDKMFVYVWCMTEKKFVIDYALYVT